MRRPGLRRPLGTAVTAAVVLSLLVALPTAQAEEPTGETVVGELVQAWAENIHTAEPEPLDGRQVEEHPEGDLVSWVETDSGEAVRVLTEDVADIPVGSTVEVTVGDEVTDAAAEEQGLEPALEVLEATVLEAAPATDAPVAPAGTATNRVTVVGVLPSGVTPGATVPITDLTAVVNGAVKSFWAEQTNGAVQIEATAHPSWVTLTAGCNDWFGMWRQADAAVNFDGTPGNGNHLLLYLGAAAQNFPTCADGLGTIGSGPGAGGLLYTKGLHPSIIAHELGHNFGLGHASALSCDSGTEEVADNSCQVDAYHDWYDVMGFSWSQMGTLNAPHAALLGVLPAGQQATTRAQDTGTRTYTLSPTGGRTGLRAVRLVDDGGIEYWLEYRTATGRDAWLPGTPLQTGVQLRRASDGDDTSLLIDATPVSGQRGDATKSALPVGTPVTVAGGDFTVTVDSVTSSGATVRVTAGRVPVGTWETLNATGPTLSIAGWVYDPDNPAAAVPLHVYVDGRLTILSANQSRSDVPSLSPGAGTSNGFSWSTTLAPGDHRVCIYAIDVNDPSKHTALGCRSLGTQVSTPVGRWESMSATGSTLSLGGWAYDPDDGAGAVPLHVWVDGRLAVVPANQSRPDVQNAQAAAGTSNGFAASIRVNPGAHRVCIYAIDLNISSRYTELGCRSITTQMALPVGNWETLAGSGSTISVAGWAFDRDDTGRSVPLHVYIDGRLTIVTADRSRPDVEGIHPGVGTGHGFSWSGTVPAGDHRVCVYAIDTDPIGGYTALGCRTVSTQVQSPVGTWESLTAAGSTVRLAGWAYDPDDNTGAVPLHVWVDGRLTMLSADRSRPDVQSAHSAAGTSNGFSGSVQVHPGTHSVCIYAIDLNITSRYTGLGCRTITTQMALPEGAWEGHSASGSTISITGWTFDRDDTGRWVPLHVYVDGRLTIITADRSRPDVGVANPGTGSDHGFAWSGTVPPGEHRVCVYAIDTDPIGGYTALGCRAIGTQVQPPMGNWESLTASGPAISIGGWVFDADDNTAAVPLHVYVDGRLTIVRADRSRPDVPGFAPGAGTSNGFSWSGTVPPGDHTVCIYAIDVNIPSKYTSLGCRTVGTQVAVPVGTWETLSAAGSSLAVAGWAYDPDTNTGAVPLHVWVDGRLTVLSADRSRPEIQSQWPAAGTSNGFSGSIRVNPGAHSVCIYAIDLNIASKYTGLGCRTITTQLALPVGSWESLTASGSTISLAGWTFDTDDHARAVPLHVYVDGRLTIITADRTRTDVGAAFPTAGNDHGFAWSGSVTPGEHRVCVYAIDTDPIGGYTALGCRAITTS
ncbi:reprolysin-like metallopeptidase [Blastococcus deserti]|uniref:Reprolysin-like metallopeptidase n=1 Tax=Blastococcus deserti TaxID=2259033 RepID=A0ABW4X4L2_9ACTN